MDFTMPLPESDNDQSAIWAELVKWPLVIYEDENPGGNYKMKEITTKAIVISADRRI